MANCIYEISRLAGNTHSRCSILVTVAWGTPGSSGDRRHPAGMKRRKEMAALREQRSATDSDCDSCRRKSASPSGRWPR